ncbi:MULTISPECIES: 16S rRNA (guanine(527)-N(7))-methyltransferase RsmG [Desulfococcus]|jgi:16S rRNA (guanine527-N7)-methyltransferase|uniref:Ribosomal RNA small subunit methyltransferase G n=1 Tax=Desulfococcus multivorans DSM 2059 TaxID=1121405 RepID=S7TX36_DESML|nr:16S rRNA (guanine(527)-N(7))-methyltransferase RsmG [Desulfococcus multivorans]AOY58106.1 RsmG: ribosomal RNA small subunit methyltransferase G [Desulfococcus multivorans]AQV00464.1 16S rRNA (guanine(527)-N(7))-methyltransferase RsmG [Desulfococcus multivorans]EPR41325.1 Ribosomal RNA small subunit methyltransferase G [Desulfococcus multivorans DSM 2059]MDX9817723.1 16S rRNA (guanine(527)-N(7))-methyltransferase RsmG [Desulfococcus multivorans]SJZ72757.1 16S rRNA (guanine527-N7)-methyltrans
MEIGSPEWLALIESGAAAMGLSVSPSQARLFARHAEVLLDWNKATNLTAITTPEAVAVKHFLDALMPSRHIPSGSVTLDIGSGGGFPGIPLKIMDPSLSVTLIDTVRKKVSFLNYLIRVLGLQDISAHHIRAEALAMQHPMAGAFDVIVCRALTALDGFIRMARPLLKSDGLLIAMKGEISEKEIIAAEALIADGNDAGNIFIDVVHYTLPVLALPRRLYLIRPSGVPL